MAEMQHGTHHNNLWFIFANISTACPVCVQYNARSSFVISSIRPAYAKIYPVAREDLAAETFFHALGRSTLLNSVTSDDLITWFGVDGPSTGDLDLPPTGCEIKRYPKIITNLESSKITTTPGSVSFITDNHREIKFYNLVTYTINIDNSSDSQKHFTKEKLQVTTETMGTSTDPEVLSTFNDKNMPTTTENSRITTTIRTATLKPAKRIKIKKIQQINKQKMRKVLLGQVQTGKTTKMSNPVKTTLKTISNHSESAKHQDRIDVSINNSSTEIESVNKTTSIPLQKLITTPGTLIESWTHQTTTFSTTASSKIDNKRGSSTTYSPKLVAHINTEQIHDIPQKFIKVKIDQEGNTKNFDVGSENDQYVLLNKDSLWDMLKEAVNDDVKRQELSNILREKEN